MSFVTSSLIDCSGRVTHSLTLMPDGVVRVEFAGGTTADIDPRSGTVLTPGRAVPEQVVAAARTLAVG
jgi:hypothetical protein